MWPGCVFVLFYSVKRLETIFIVNWCNMKEKKEFNAFDSKAEFIRLRAPGDRFGALSQETNKNIFYLYKLQNIQIQSSKIIYNCLWAVEVPDPLYEAKCRTRGWFSPG